MSNIPVCSQKMLGRDFGGVDSPFPFLSPWQGETPRVVSDLSASDIFMPAWFRGCFSAPVFKQKLSQIDGGGFGTSTGGARKGEFYGGGGREVKWALENHKICIESGGRFFSLGLSFINCWFWSDLIKDPKGWPQMCWAAWGKLGFLATWKLPKVEFRLSLSSRFALQAPYSCSQSFK